MLRARAQDALMRLTRKVLQAEGSCLASLAPATMAQADERLATRVHALSVSCRFTRLHLVGVYILLIPLTHALGLIPGSG